MATNQQVHNRHRRTRSVPPPAANSTTHWQARRAIGPPHASWTANVHHRGRDGEQLPVCASAPLGLLRWAGMGLSGGPAANGFDQGADPGGVTELFPRERELANHAHAASRKRLPEHGEGLARARAAGCEEDGALSLGALESGDGAVDNRCRVPPPDRGPDHDAVIRRHVDHGGFDRVDLPAAGPRRPAEVRRQPSVRGLGLHLDEVAAAGVTHPLCQGAGVPGVGMIDDQGPHAAVRYG